MVRDVSRVEVNVSLGVPVFNGEPYLRETLDSLLDQTFEDFEIVLADNASTDATPEICAEYAAKDSRISFHASPQNRGAAWNYNRVFELAKGRYFKWAAADDVLDPGYLEACVSVLDADPSVAIAYPRTRIIDAQGLHLHDYEEDLHLVEASAASRFRRILLALREANAVFGLMRADMMKSTALIGPYASSDLVLLGEMALRGKFYQVPQTLFSRRDHQEQSMKAYEDAVARNAWFDPARTSRWSFPAWRLGVEYARAVRRAPLTRRGRAWCWAQLVFWPRAQWKTMGLDVVKALISRRGPSVPRSC